MKKSFLGILAAAALSFTAVSCGDKLLTEEQVQSEIQKGFVAGRAAVESEMNARCDQEFDMRVTMAVDSLRMQDSINNAMTPGGR